MKLEVSLFRFDYKSDYLPYYTKNIIKITSELNLLDLLNTISTKNVFAFENNLDFCVVVNEKYLKVSTSLDEIIENFGKELTIEPISIRRAHTDLLINDADFQERLGLLSEFIEPEHKNLYESYKIYYYASNTLNYEYDYIGDSLILLASHLIDENNSEEKAILKALKEYECSVEFHTSLENRIFNFDKKIEEKIQTIKNKLHLSKEISSQNFSINNKNNLKFQKSENNSEIEYDFNDFNIAYFKGLTESTGTLNFLSKLKAKIINSSLMDIDLALDSFHINEDFTFKLAASVMIEAFDNAADFLLVDDDNLFNLFDSNRKSLEKVSGREIILPVIHKTELEKLAFGLHSEVKKSLSKHEVNPELI